MRALYRSEKGKWEAFWKRLYTPSGQTLSNCSDAHTIYRLALGP
jgi:hypothetical protein